MNTVRVRAKAGKRAASRAAKTSSPRLSTATRCVGPAASPAHTACAEHVEVQVSLRNVVDEELPRLSCGREVPANAAAFLRIWSTRPPGTRNRGSARPPSIPWATKRIGGGVLPEPDGPRDAEDVAPGIPPPSISSSAGIPLASSRAASYGVSGRRVSREAGRSSIPDDPIVSVCLPAEVASKPRIFRDAGPAAVDRLVRLVGELPRARRRGRTRASLPISAGAYSPRKSRVTFRVGERGRLRSSNTLPHGVLAR